MGPPVRLSVVIPARDAEAAIAATLLALQRQTVATDALEVVVVDNASGDRTAEVARRHGARVVAEPVPGRPRARNRGVAAAHAPLVAFLDAECTPEPAWAEALLGCLERRAIVAGPVRIATRPDPNVVERFDRAWRLRQEATVPQGWAASCNLAVRRELFDRLGGFDESFRRAAEDVDLCLRAREAGEPVALCRGALVSHPAERRLRGVVRRGLRQGHGAAQQHMRTGGAIGRRHWRHPRPLLSGDWPLRGLGVDPAGLLPGERRRLLAVARADYAARVAGSLLAEATERRGRPR